MVIPPAFIQCEGDWQVIKIKFQGKIPDAGIIFGVVVFNLVLQFVCNSEPVIAEDC